MLSQLTGLMNFVQLAKGRGSDAPEAGEPLGFEAVFLSLQQDLGAEAATGEASDSPQETARPSAEVQPVEGEQDATVQKWDQADPERVAPARADAPTRESAQVRETSSRTAMVSERVESAPKLGEESGGPMFDRGDLVIPSVAKPAVGPETASLPKAPLTLMTGAHVSGPEENNPAEPSERRLPEGVSLGTTPEAPVFGGTALREPRDSRLDGEHPRQLRSRGGAEPAWTASRGLAAAALEPTDTEPAPERGAVGPAREAEAARGGLDLRDRPSDREEPLETGAQATPAAVPGAIPEAHQVDQNAARMVSERPVFDADHAPPKTGMRDANLAGETLPREAAMAAGDTETRVQGIAPDPQTMRPEAGSTIDAARQPRFETHAALPAARHTVPVGEVRADDVSPASPVASVAGPQPVAKPTPEAIEETILDGQIASWDGSQALTTVYTGAAAEPAPAGRVAPQDMEMPNPIAAQPQSRSSGVAHTSAIGAGLAESPEPPPKEFGDRAPLARALREVALETDTPRPERGQGLRAERTTRKTEADTSAAVEDGPTRAVRFARATGPEATRETVVSGGTSLSRQAVVQGGFAGAAPALRESLAPNGPKEMPRHGPALRTATSPEAPSTASHPMPEAAPALTETRPGQGIAVVRRLSRETGELGLPPVLPKAAPRPRTEIKPSDLTGRMKARGPETVRTEAIRSTTVVRDRHRSGPEGARPVPVTGRSERAVASPDKVSPNRAGSQPVQTPAQHPQGRGVLPSRWVESIVAETAPQPRRPRGAGEAPAGVVSFGTVRPTAEPPSVPVLVKASPPVQQQTAGSVLSPVLDDSEPLTKEGTLGGLPGDARSAPAPIAAQPIALPARSETAASVLSQLSDAVAGTPLQADELIEVKLNPEELGHVRFRMGQGEHGLMLTITAERPETLDLLRRHVDQLARYLADMGHGSASFSFGERGSGGRTGPDAGQRQEIGPALPADPSPPPVPAAASDGLDIRL